MFQLVLPVVLCGILSRFHEPPTVSVLLPALAVLAVSGYRTLLLTLILTAFYRLCLHPLSRFPGSKLGALTKLYEYAHVRGGRNFLRVLDEHQRVGDFVRTGPNELSICNVEAVQAVLGRKQESTRGPFYALSTLNRGIDSLITVRDSQTHAAWRRIWDKAFTAGRVRKYSQNAETHVERLIRRLERLQGQDVDAASIAGEAGFDIMADTSFGSTSRMQEGRGDATYLPAMRKYLRVLSSYGSLRNLCELVPYLPEPRDVTVFHEKGMGMVMERMKLGTQRDDVWTQLLLAEDGETGMRLGEGELLAAAQLVIVAGTDTTAVVLATAYRLLALHPEKQEKLYRQIVAELDDICAATVQSGRPAYLDAVINEALRLGTPVPSGIQMTTKTEGVTVAGRFIPGRTDVRIPHFALMTDERYFPRGREFIPERWTSERPDMVRDRRAFIPFAYGAHACPGKALAMNELRLAIAHVVKRFVIEQGAGYDEKAFWRGVTDNFTLQLGPLPLRFSARR